MKREQTKSMRVRSNFQYKITKLTKNPKRIKSKAQNTKKNKNKL